MGTINNILSEELLLIIFEQFVTNDIIIKWDNKIYLENCGYCKDERIMMNNMYEEYHLKEHEKIMSKEQIKNKCITMNKEFENIQQLKLTCRKWRNICHEYQRQILKEGFTKRQMLRNTIK